MDVEIKIESKGTCLFYVSYYVYWSNCQGLNEQLNIKLRIDIYADNNGEGSPPLLKVLNKLRTEMQTRPAGESAA